MLMRCVTNLPVAGLGRFVNLFTGNEKCWCNFSAEEDFPPPPILKSNDDKAGLLYFCFSGRLMKTISQFYAGRRKDEIIDSISHRDGIFFYYSSGLLEGIVILAIWGIDCVPNAWLGLKLSSVSQTAHKAR